jgi:hypothetical protein
MTMLNEVDTDEEDTDDDYEYPLATLNTMTRAQYEAAGQKAADRPKEWEFNKPEKVKKTQPVIQNPQKARPPQQQAQAPRTPPLRQVRQHTPPPQRQRENAENPLAPNIQRLLRNNIKNTHHTEQSQTTPDIHQQYTPPPQPFKRKVTPVERADIDLDENVENVQIEYATPDKRMFEEQINLETAVDTTNVGKFLPKQVDLQRIIDQIQNKVIRQTHLPASFKDIKSHYLKSPHFKDIYMYLKDAKTPKDKRKSSTCIHEADKYLLLDELLFKINEHKDELTTRLCIPTTLVDMILYWYHSSRIGAHMGITKCVQTIRQKFYCPELERHARAYITGCHICQQFKSNKDKRIQYKHRVNVNTFACTKFSMDIKYMPTSSAGYNFILVLICETSNMLVVAPLKTRQTPEICQALIDKAIGYYGVPTHIICDEDPAFTSGLAQHMYQHFDIQLLTVGPTNHQSNQAEHGIKSLSKLIMSHLTGLGNDWHEYLSMCMLSYNAYATPNMDNVSPFEMVYGRKANLIPDIEIQPDIKIGQTHKQGLDKLQKKLQYLRTRIQKFRLARRMQQNKDRKENTFYKGQLVYMFQPRGAMLQTGSRKINCKFVGPLVIHKVISDNLFMLMSLDGTLYHAIVDASKLKPGFVKTAFGNMTTLAGLRQTLRGKVPVHMQEKS